MEKIDKTCVCPISKTRYQRVMSIIHTLQPPVTETHKTAMTNAMEKLYNDIMSLQKDYRMFAVKEAMWKDASKCATNDLQMSNFQFLSVFEDDNIKKEARGKMTQIIDLVVKPTNENFKKERKAFMPRVVDLFKRSEFYFFFPINITKENFLKHLVSNEACMTPPGFVNAAQVFPTLYMDPRGNVQAAIANAISTINVIYVFGTKVDTDVNSVKILPDDVSVKVIENNKKGPQLVIDKCINNCTSFGIYNSDCTSKVRPPCKFDVNCDTVDPAFAKCKIFKDTCYPSSSKCYSYDDCCF